MRSNAFAANLSITLGAAETANIYEKTALLLLAQCEPYPDVLAGLYHLANYRLVTGDNHSGQSISAFIANHSGSTFVVRLHAQSLMQEIMELSPQNIGQAEPVEWHTLVSQTCQ